MKYQAILFDMDGTLIPQDLMTFLYGILEEQCRSMSGLGVPYEKLRKACYDAFWAMIKNDGSSTNEECYFSALSELLGLPRETVKQSALQFFCKEFDCTQKYTRQNPLAPEAYRRARACAEKVVVATNPVFPAETQRLRMKWVGLDYDAFDLVTSFETDSSCKPSETYYRSVCERIGVSPKDCLMIGNDETEDMYGASVLGMDTFLVTDCLISRPEHSYHGKKGSFAELVDYLASLEPETPSVDYRLLNDTLASLIDGVPYPIANLSNASALLYETLPDLNWAGFYLMQDGKLVLGPFQGKPACIEIPVGKGVCGTAAQLKKPVRVPDVHQFPGHIACDSASASELVIPICKNGEVVGVLDLDSPHKDRFSKEDEKGLSEFVSVLERAFIG